MAQALRQAEILEILRKQGKITVDALAEKLDVTLQTIRRDLSELADAGKVERVHGGAMLPSGTVNIAYEQRRNLNYQGKAGIAAACSQSIPHGCSVFINLGTTTEAVARELLAHKDILVVTNNINVANILNANEDCEVIVTGGALRRSDGGLIGTLTIDTIARFKFDYAVIGCSAIDEAGDFLDYDVQEVSVAQRIINQTRDVYLVADHLKFQRHAPAKIGSLGEISALFTDRAVPRAVEDKCIQDNTRVIVAN